MCNFSLKFETSPFMKETNATHAHRNKIFNNFALNDVRANCLRIIFDKISVHTLRECRWYGGEYRSEWISLPTTGRTRLMRSGGTAPGLKALDGPTQHSDISLNRDLCRAIGSHKRRGRRRKEPHLYLTLSLTQPSVTRRRTYLTSLSILPLCSFRPRIFTLRLLQISLVPLNLLANRPDTRSRWRGVWNGVTRS